MTQPVPAPFALLVTGIPGAGKTTVSRLLAARFERAAHVEADRLQEMIVSGLVWPHQDPAGEAKRQLELRAEQAARVADGFFAAGFIPVIDDVVVGAERLALYERLLRARPLHLVVLAPPVDVVLARDATREYKRVGERWAHLDADQREQLSGRGSWLDTADQTPEQTVDAILRLLAIDARP